MSFSETIFLFFLALIVFGPKKLPEIARQAGKLLAELRRASNEFKSQIETEIAHLEVEKAKTAITTPSGPPPGAVASMSLNPATAAHSAVPLSSASLAGTAVGSAAGTADAAAESAAAPDPAAALPTEPVAASTEVIRESVSAPQDSHV